VKPVPTRGVRAVPREAVRRWYQPDLSYSANVAGVAAVLILLGLDLLTWFLRALLSS